MKGEMMDNFDIIETALESFVDDVNLRTAQGNRDTGKEMVIKAAYEALNRIDEEHDSLKARSDLFEKLVGALDRAMRNVLADNSPDPRSYRCPYYPSQHSPGNPDQYCSEGTCGWFRECKALTTAQALLKPSVSSGQGEAGNKKPTNGGYP